MARMNDLLNKYGVRPTGHTSQTAQETPQPPPDERHQPETPFQPGEPPQLETPPGSHFQIKRGPTGAASSTAPPFRREEPQGTADESRRHFGPGSFSSMDAGEGHPPRQGAEETSAMPGAFGRSREDWCPPPDNHASRREPAVRRPSRLPRSLMDQLPALWGIDLALILISLVGIIAILVNLRAILLALAKMVCSVIGIAIGVLLLLILVITARYFLRRPPW